MYAPKRRSPGSRWTAGICALIYAWCVLFVAADHNASDFTGGIGVRGSNAAPSPASRKEAQQICLPHSATQDDVCLACVWDQAGGHALSAVFTVLRPESPAVQRLSADAHPYAQLLHFPHPPRGPPVI